MRYINIKKSGATSIYVPMFNNDNALKTVNIGDSVLLIPNVFVKDCKGIDSITIPQSVTSIGDSAFVGCTGLKRVNFNAKNASYSTYAPAFAGDTSIMEVNIGDSVQSLPNLFMSYSNGFDTITIPASVSSLGSGAFAKCYGLTTVNYNATNATYNYMGDEYHSMFSGDSNLSCVNIGYGVQSIPNNFIYDCKKITDISIPNSVTAIGSYSFSNTGLKSVVLPNSIISLGYGAFAENDSLQYVTFSNSLTAIAGMSFKDCKSLKRVTIPEGVINIERNAFGNCIGLKKVSLPSTLTTIVNAGFYDCQNIDTLICKAQTPPQIENHTFYNVSKTIPLLVPCGKVSAYQNAPYWNAFTNIQEDCSSIEDVREESDNEIAFYPNPAQEEITIACSFKIQTIEVYNLLGQKIEERKVNGYTTKLNTQSYSKGAYTCKIKTDNGFAIKKFVVR